jgi:hypothetical protein
MNIEGGVILILMQGVSTLLLHVIFENLPTTVKMKKNNKSNFHMTTVL